MKARSAVVYSVLRLLAFAVPFAIMMLFPIMREFYWLSAIFAALIGLSLSMLFLRQPLNDVTSGLAERRARISGAQQDADDEDAALDAPAGEAQSAPEADQTANAQNKTTP